MQNTTNSILVSTLSTVCKIEHYTYHQSIKINGQYMSIHGFSCPDGAAELLYNLVIQSGKGVYRQNYATKKMIYDYTIQCGHFRIYMQVEA